MEAESILPHSFFATYLICGFRFHRVLHLISILFPFSICFLSIILRQFQLWNLFIATTWEMSNSTRWHGLIQEKLPSDVFYGIGDKWVNYLKLNLKYLEPSDSITIRKSFLGLRLEPAYSSNFVCNCLHLNRTPYCHRAPSFMHSRTWEFIIKKRNSKKDKGAALRASLLVLLKKKSLFFLFTVDYLPIVIHQRTYREC